MKLTPNKPFAAILISLLVAVLVAGPGFVLAFTVLGGSLGITTTGSGWQRDVHVWNNSPDAASNNNITPNLSYPGALGAVMSTWKAAHQWASDTPLAAKNFDFDWQGTATSSPPDANTVSWGSTGCSGGVLAYTETPISDGWRILVCDSWTWDDGPGTPISGVDIEGVLTHELGHALGLGHSQSGNCGGVCSTNPTMCAFICNTGAEQRTIEADDAAGLQSIYGTIPGNKPVITGLSGSLANGGTLIITGSNFAATVNVKFTSGTGLNTGLIPGVVTGVPSSAGGTQISVVIPAAAIDGNVIVWEPALNVISNAFPIDVNYAPPAPPAITSFSPSNVTAFGGGVVTMTGTGFLNATSMDVGGTILTIPANFTIVSDTSITFTAPTATALGPVNVTVTGPAGTSAPNQFTYVETNPAKLAAPAIALSNQLFTWNFGAGANDIAILLAATDNTTNTFGTPWPILVNYLIVSNPTCNAAGIGSYALVIPPGLQAVTFYSQVVALDENTGGLNSASNITNTFILF